jgi:hypothetical protein
MFFSHPLVYAFTAALGGALMAYAYISYQELDESEPAGIADYFRVAVGEVAGIYCLFYGVHGLIKNLV